MNMDHLLKRLPSLGHMVAFVAVFLFFGTSVFAASDKLASYLTTTLDIETNETFRRLVADNPLLIRTVSSIEDVVEKITESTKAYGKEGEGEDDKKVSITTDKILSLLGITSFSPISSVASSFSGLSSGEGNFIVGEGLVWSVKSGSQARESLSLGSSDTPTFGGLKIDTDQVFKKEEGDVLKLLSIDSLDSTTENTIETFIDTLEGISSIGGVGSTTRATLESALEADIDTLEGISSVGSSGSTTRQTLETAIETDIDSLPGISTIGSTTEDTLESALDISGDVTSTGMLSTVVGKIHGITFGTPTATSGNLLIADGDSWESVGMSGDATITSGGVISINSVQNNSVALGTDTTGNYVATIADGGSGHLSISGSGSETASVTLSIAGDSLDWSELSDSMTLDTTTTIDMDTNNADLNFDNGTLFIDSSSGYVGVGTITPLTTLSVKRGSPTNPSTSTQDAAIIRSESDTTKTLRGAWISIEKTNTSNHTGSNMALNSFAYYLGSGGLSRTSAPGALTGGRYATRIAGTASGTVATATGLNTYIYTASTTTANITTARALWIEPTIHSGSGTISNLYGLYVDEQTEGLDNYAIYTVGSTKNYFGGNVGIGTTSPSALLHLGIGDTNVVGQKIVLASGATANALEVNTSSGVGGDLFVIDSSGNVGIGTTNPQNFLHIESTSAQQIRLAYSSTAYTRFNVAGSGAFTIQTTSTTGSNIALLLIPALTWLGLALLLSKLLLLQEVMKTLN